MDEELPADGNLVEGEPALDVQDIEPVSIRAREVLHLENLFVAVVVLGRQVVLIEHLEDGGREVLRRSELLNLGERVLDLEVAVGLREELAEIPDEEALVIGVRIVELVPFLDE